MDTCALRPPSVVLNRVSRQYTFEKKKKRLRGITPPTLSQHRCHQQRPCHALLFWRGSEA